MSLERLRRIAAVLIAISLLLPLRSCVTHGKAGVKTEIFYPLSPGQTWDGQLIVAALFVLPLVSLFVCRNGMASILSRIALAAVGLYLISFGTYAFATKLLIGWYTYTVGALVYLGLSIVELYRKIVQRKKLISGVNETNNQKST